MTCPGEVITYAYNPDIEGASIYWSPDMFPYSDNSMVDVTLIIDPASGSILSGRGDHTITVTAIDQSMNEGTCTFTVTVIGKVCPFYRHNHQRSK